jgi:DNA-binding transcriptional LysR family regulator
MVLKEKLKEAGSDEKNLSVVMELGSTQAVITAVEAGLGLGFVSRWAAEAALKVGTVKQVKVPDLDLKRELYIVTLENINSTKARDILCDYLKQEAHC